MRTKKQDAAKKTFRVPGGLLFPFIGIEAIIWLLTSLSKWEILSTGIFISAVSMIYFFMKKFKNKNIEAVPTSELNQQIKIQTT